MTSCLELWLCAGLPMNRNGLGWASSSVSFFSDMPLTNGHDSVFGRSSWNSVFTNLPRWVTLALRHSRLCCCELIMLISTAQPNGLPGQTGTIDLCLCKVCARSMTSLLNAPIANRNYLVNAEVISPGRNAICRSFGPRQLRSSAACIYVTLLVMGISPGRYVASRSFGPRESW